MTNKKLDKMDNTGKSTTYKGSDKIVYVIDDNSGKERVTSHVNYDEAYTSVSANNQPPMATSIPLFLLIISRLWQHHFNNQDMY